MRTREEAYVLWFDELRKEDVALVGGKSSSLGEMTSQTKAPVPYGFATTAHGYRYFMEATGTNQKIHKELAELENVDDSIALSKVCKRIREMIMAAIMPEDLQEAIETAYDQLAEKIGESDPFVAVRSSATAEDLPDASFAGQQDTYLNVKGKAEVVEKVKECYASCFTDRAVYYREKQGFSHEDVALSAAVQLMAFSKAAGVMFTVDISNGSDENIMIEGAWGLGEYVVQGTVTPDNFLVRKSDLSIVRKQINRKPIELVQKEDGGVEERKVPDERANAPAITDEQVKELARIALAIEKHYGCYMDMEWAVDRRDNQIKILQARPETVWSRKKKEKSTMTTNHHVLVKGLPASPGVPLYNTPIKTIQVSTNLSQTDYAIIGTELNKLQNQKMKVDFQSEKNMLNLSTIMDTINPLLFSEISPKSMAEEISARISNALINNINPNKAKHDVPYLFEFLTPEFIRLDVECTDWQNAIKISGQPLLKKGYINQHYIDSIIDITNNLGPYYIIGPNIALPHAGIDDGCFKTGMSMIRLSHPVNINTKKGEPIMIKYFVFLCSSDEKSHLQAFFHLLSLIHDTDILKEMDDISNSRTMNYLLQIREIELKDY